MVLPSPKAPIARAIGEARIASSGVQLGPGRGRPMRRSLIAESIQAMAAVAAIAAARGEQDPPRQCEIAWNDLITHERHHSQPWASHSPGKEGDD